MSNTLDKKFQKALTKLKNKGKNLKIVKNNPYAICNIKDPSKEIELLSIKNNVYNIRYIKNPSEEIQLEVVRKNGSVIQDIENPNEKVQLEAVKQNKTAIKYIKNPTDKVKYFVANGKLPTEKEQVEEKKIKDIKKNPSEEVQLAATKQSNR